MSTSDGKTTRITVALGEQSYPILIGSGILRNVGREFRRSRLPHQLVVITDRTVLRLHAARLLTALRKAGFSVLPIVVPSGENEKSIERAKKIFTAMIESRIERRSAVVAFGGGVVGDLAGFVAATFQRGVPFVQIPTTLLAQVDSSVGGKVAVNHPLAKNMIGAFHQPSLVLADLELLRTLPQRELLCGLGEVVKYGIVMRKEFFGFLERRIDDAIACDGNVLRKIVSESCGMKSLVVSQDEREGGLRAILNFGHTIGHALEHEGGYHRMKHGEAVLAGMAAETYVAKRMGLLSKRHADRIYALIRRFPLPALKGLLREERLLSTMKMDKKVSGGRIRLVLPRSIGHAALPRPVPLEVLREAIRTLPEILGQ